MNKAIDNQELWDAMPMVMPFLFSFLDSSRVVYLTIIEDNGNIRFINRALAKIIKVDRAEMVGKNFAGFLTGPDGESLIKRLLKSASPPFEEQLLNVVDSDQVPHSLCFRLASLERGFFLLGEPPMEDNQNLQEELIQLNNQLSVLSRENVRKGRELSRALAELKQTQAMLVHHEKMASLGQMTAGIAHEINNPLAFVLNNEQVLNRDFDDLLSFINAVGDVLPEIAVLAPGIHAMILGKAGEAGLEYLAEAVPRKIKANIEGLERVKDIILDLRKFSRLDEAERKLCDITEGIEATIRFLGPLLQEGDIAVETRYATRLQLVCAPGPLNQAISNVMANAIQASAPGQTVRVSTGLDSDWYCIEVADKGSGIPAEHLEKVFDPFFTTKPVGSGTGLGLSIAHQVVAAHNGQIKIDSLPGSGTTVRICLPLKEQDSATVTGEGKSRGA